MFKPEIVEYCLKDLKTTTITINGVDEKEDYENFLQSKKTNYDWGVLVSGLENGYKPETYGYIETYKNGYIIDGHHRVVVLSRKNINQKIYIKRHPTNYYKLISYPFTVIALIIYIPIKIFNFLFKKLKSIFK
jgi:hypothetical protein